MGKKAKTLEPINAPLPSSIDKILPLLKASLLKDYLIAIQKIDPTASISSLAICTTLLHKNDIGLFESAGISLRDVRKE